MTLADRLIVMNAGVADQIGTPMDVYDRPASVFVAGFIGSPADELPRRQGVGRRQGGRNRGPRHLRRVGAAAGAARPPQRQMAQRWRWNLGPSTCCPASDGPLEFTIEMAEPLGADTLLCMAILATRANW